MSTGPRVRLRCPVCERALASAPLMQHATLVVRRTCATKGCRNRWSVRLRPFARGAAYTATEATWTPLGRVRA